MNKHTHQHRATCLKTPKGRLGCRMFVPYAHDGTDKTTLRELRPLKSVDEADDQKVDRQQHHHHQDEDDSTLIVDGSPTLTAHRFQRHLPAGR